jgi:hypothetical protein
MALFADRDGAGVLVAPGDLDRFSFADQAYLLLAGALGPDEVDRRCTAWVMPGSTTSISTPLSPTLVLALRVEQRSLVDDDGQLLLGPPGVGVPVTVASLTGLAECTELC